MSAKVLIVMGSDSDMEVMRPAAQVLDELGVPWDVAVASAHRTPDRVVDLARNARGRGICVFIAGAGGAHHLGGVLAANSTLPVLAVPLAVGTLGGLDALLSAIQMPGGVPVASVGVGNARNAGLFAAAMISVNDPAVAKALDEFRKKQEQGVGEADARVRTALQPKKK